MKWQQEYVESLVRELPLRERVKDRLREELWGHLSAAYAEELVLSDEETARHNACSRIGGDGELERVLRSSLSGPERMEGVVLEACTSGGFGIARRLVLRFVGVSFVVLILSLALAGLPGMSTLSALITWITCSMAVAIVFASRVHLSRAAGGGRGILRSAAALCVSTVLVCVVGIGAAVLVCACFDSMEMTDVVRQFAVQVIVPLAIWLWKVGSIAGRAIEWRERRSRTLPDWPYAEFG